MAIERPAAVAQARVILLQELVPLFRQHLARPAERQHMRHRLGLVFVWHHATLERGIEPARDRLVDDGVELALGESVHAALVGRRAGEVQLAAPRLELGQAEAVVRQELVRAHARGVRRILLHRNGERHPLLAHFVQRSDAGLRVDDDGEPVPRRIDRDHAQGQRRLEHADAPVGLREQRRGVDHRHLERAVGNRVGEHRRAGRHPEPGAEIGARAVADHDAHVAIPAVRRRRVAGHVEAELPEHLGAREVRASRQCLHGPFLLVQVFDLRRARFGAAGGPPSSMAATASTSPSLACVSSHVNGRCG